MKYQILDLEFGNIVGLYPTLPAAIDYLTREALAGGPVETLAAISWPEGRLRIDVRGEEIARGAFVSNLIAYIGPRAPIAQAIHAQVVTGGMTTGQRARQAFSLVTT